MLLDHYQLEQYDRLKKKEISAEGLDELEKAALMVLHKKYQKHLETQKKLLKDTY